MKKLSLLFISLIFISSHIFAQREQDSLALIKFYEATGGNNWERSTNWLSSEPISEWIGVTVVEDRVQKLSFYANNLEGTLPVEIGNLSALTDLIIIGDPLLTGNLPDEIGNLTELSRLILHGDGFSGNIPTSIGNLTKLTELTLSDNQFSGSIPEEIGNLSILEELLLGQNELSGTIPATLGNLSMLSRLELSENDFSGALFPEMINLTALERIYLSDNEFTSLIDFSGFTNLRYLGVEYNMLDFEDLELANINQDNVNISYENQKIKLPIEKSLSGSEYTLSSTYSFNETSFQWQRDAQTIDGETNNNIIVADNEIGVYDYVASHPNWPDLSLESESVIIGDLHGGVILSDSLALADLYQNTDGDKWYSHIGYNDTPDNWLSEEPISRWWGVSISNGRVISIDLEENNLTGTIPTSIGDLDSLNFLSLEDNKLTGTIPAEIGTLNSLKELYLSNNQLTGTIPAEMENLSKLEILYLRNNNLDGVIPSGINQLNKLTKLSLRNNQFSGNLPDLSNLISLTYLSISNNELTGLSDLSALTNLTTIYLSSNLFDFESFEVTQIDWSTDGFHYSPQNYQLPHSEQINGSDITLSVNYDYAGTTYQWYKDKQPILNETTKTLTIADSNEGVYQCKANHNNLPELTLETEVYINGELHGGVLLSDSLALVAFYNSTNGDTWTDNTNWLSNEPIDDWEGIVVENGRVNNLALTENNLIGNLPLEIGDLTYLNKIILWDNMLSGNIPSEIGNLKSIEGLYLNNNQLSGSIPTTIGEMKSLTDIWLDNNNLTGEIPSEIGNIAGLQRFYADGNQLTGTIPVSFGQLQELYVLLLDRNQLSGSLPIEMANMSDLRIFRINDNKFNDLTDLSALPELFDCQVQNNLLDFESIDKAQIDWGGYYSKYDPQNLILPILESNDGTNYTFEVDYTYAGVTYQWYKNDILIDGETNQSISFPMTELGDYYCLVDYANLPDLTLKSETISITTVRIEKPGAFVSKVFPNPTFDYLKIQIEKPLENTAFLELKGITGNTVLTQNVGNKTQIKLQLSHLSKGIYFLKIRNGEETFVQKIILK